MRELLSQTREYCVVILKSTPKRSEAGADQIAWEHGRRNFALRAEGVLSIVCPIRDGGEISGVSIFSASVEETQKIMDEDPGVRAGIFTYEVHSSRSFPGDRLP